MNTEMQVFSISRKKKPEYEHGVAHKVYENKLNSENWIDSLTYMEDIDKTKLANGKWITVDDILNEDEIVEKIIDAFVKFLHIENQ